MITELTRCYFVYSTYRLQTRGLLRSSLASKAVSYLQGRKSGIATLQCISSFIPLIETERFIIHLYRFTGSRPSCGM